MITNFARTRLALAAIAAVAILALSATVAFAGPPVLPAGVTSAPGMHGTCTNCHTYAKPAAASTTPAAVKAVAVSHPFAAGGKHRVGKTLKLWGYVSPKLPNVKEATITVLVGQKVGNSWVATSSLNTTGTVSAKGKFRNKTNYTASVVLPKAAWYRFQMKLVWTDAKGVEHTKSSKRTSIRVFK